MKPAVCDLCGSANQKVVGPSRGNTLVECSLCGHLYLRLRPVAEELPARYTEAVFNEKYIQGNEQVQQAYAQDKPKIMVFARRRFDTLDRLHAPGALLDVGCALGFYLEEGRRRGWDVHGLELSGYAARIATDAGFRVTLGDVTSAEFEDASFDAVTLWLVIEHLLDPVTVIRKINRWLRPGGLIGVKVPNAGGLTFRLNLKRWLEQRDEDHICDWSSDSLSRLLDICGFDVMEWETEGIYLDRALDALVPEGHTRATLTRPDVRGAVEELYAALAGRLKFGDSLVMFGRKRGATSAEQATADR